MLSLISHSLFGKLGPAVLYSPRSLGQTGEVVRFSISENEKEKEALPYKKKELTLKLFFPSKSNANPSANQHPVLYKISDL